VTGRKCKGPPAQSGYASGLCRRNSGLTGIVQQTLLIVHEHKDQFGGGTW